MSRLGELEKPPRLPAWGHGRFYMCCLGLLVLANVSFAQLKHIEMAANLLNQGQRGPAETEARKALGNPSTRALALAMLGTIRLQEGKYKESTHFLTQALALNPRLVGARTSLGNAYLLQGKSHLAKKVSWKPSDLIPATSTPALTWPRWRHSSRIIRSLWT